MKKLLAVLSLSLTVLPAFAYAGYEEPYCREYTKNVVVGNKVQEGYGTACLQPDGSWEIVSEAPQQVITYRDPVPMPTVSQPFWERRTYYRPAYVRPASSLVVGFNFDSGSFFTSPRPRHYRDNDHHRRDHDRRDHRDHGRRNWHH